MESWRRSAQIAVILLIGAAAGVCDLFGLELAEEELGIEAVPRLEVAL